VRELLYDTNNKLVRDQSQRRRRAASTSSSNAVEATVSASNEPPPGFTRKETEGVFVVKDGKAIYTPVKVGVAGERYFEVLDGLKDGDKVITGPFSSVREIADGDAVRLQESTTRTRPNRN
jgi:HlyD family secretion protein